MKWDEYLLEIKSSDFTKLFENDARVLLLIDTPVNTDRQSVRLDKKDATISGGKQYDSILQLLSQNSQIAKKAKTKPINSFSEFINGYELSVDDASPDTVLSIIVFVAQLIGIKIPEDFWSKWLEPITSWEASGNTKNPNQSWPVLASALAHQYLEVDSYGDSKQIQLAKALSYVSSFAVETILSGHNPNQLPVDAEGEFSGLARAAYQYEMAHYREKIFTCDQHQLSFPVAKSKRKNLVDALFTSEKEFAGVFKVWARNDHENSPTKQGYGFLCVERPELKENLPQYWMTISIDRRRNIDLKELWLALEKAETEAWLKAGLDRVVKNSNSRELPWLNPAEQIYHQQWYIDEYSSIIGSPYRQQIEPQNENIMPGSLLTNEQVQEIIFKVYNPIADIKLGSQPNEQKYDLHNLPALLIREPKSKAARTVIAGWWSKSEPLPLVNNNDYSIGRTRLIIRAMASRTLQNSEHRILLDAPQLDNLTVVVCDNALCVITTNGVFLLDTGRPQEAPIKIASELAKRQMRLANDLDLLQSKIEKLTDELHDKIGSRLSIDQARAHRRECIKIQSELIRMRGLLDKPLKASEAALEPLQLALSDKWNLKQRLDQFSSDIDWLERSGNSAEEIRIFRAGRWAAGLALILLITDVFHPIVVSLLSEYPQISSFTIFVFLLIFSFFVVVSASNFLRSRL